MRECCQTLVTCTDEAMLLAQMCVTRNGIELRRGVARGDIS